MKDKRLEKEFEEYFEGVNISNDILADAKANVSPKRKVMPKIVKYASIAAGIVLAFAVTLIITFSAGLNGFSPDEGSMAQGSLGANGNSSGGKGEDSSGGKPGGGSSGSDGTASVPPNDAGSSNGDSSSSETQFEFYYDRDLTIKDIAVGDIPSLKFIEACLNEGATVGECKAAYKGEALYLVKAALNRDGEATDVFVEFTDGKLIYGELAKFYEGEKHYYNDVEYLLTRTSESGKTNSKLLIVYGGVKYYFSISSSDENAYMEYLRLIVK